MGKRLPAAKWSEVDWSLSDSDIGRRLGVTPQAAQLQRKARGLPPAKRGGPRSPNAMRVWVAAHAPDLAALSAQKVADAYEQATGRRVDRNSALQAMRNAGIPRVGPRSALVDANWDLPSPVLAEVWGLSRFSVRNRRHLDGAPRARWLPNANADPSYRAAVKAEWAKARPAGRATG